jgi:hypothetical protein
MVQTALQAFNNIRAILGDDHWSQHPEVSLKVFLRLAECGSSIPLSSCHAYRSIQAQLVEWYVSRRKIQRILTLPSVNYMSSIALVEECLVHAHSGEDKARLLWIRSRVHWVRNDFVLALEDVLQALGFLDTPINPNPTSSDLDTALDEAKDRIMAIGVDGILNLPRCKSERSDLIAGLLVEGANHAYWGRKPEVVESLGWEVSHRREIHKYDTYVISDRPTRVAVRLHSTITLYRLTIAQFRHLPWHRYRLSIRRCLYVCSVRWPEPSMLILVGSPRGPA